MYDIGHGLGDGHGTTGMCGFERTDREQLAAIAATQRPRKHVERARIVLAWADGSSAAGGANIGVSGRRVAVATTLAESGVEGLLRTEPQTGKTPIAAEATARVVALTCTEPPHRRPLDRPGDGRGNGISLGSVQRIWRAHKLQRTGCAPSNARAIRALPQASDIVGLMSIRRRSGVLSIDEKSRSRPRPQPTGLPIKPGRCRHDARLQAARHDHLFAALGA